MTKLPLDPVALIRIAADDVEKTLTQDNVRVNMTAWIKRSTYEDRCTVCLAGAVLLNTLGITSASGLDALIVSPTDQSTLHQICALDYLRAFKFDGFFDSIEATYKEVGEQYVAPPAELIDDLSRDYPSAKARWFGSISNDEIPTLVAQLRDIANMIEEAMKNEKAPA